MPEERNLRLDSFNLLNYGIRKCCISAGERYLDQAPPSVQYMMDVEYEAYFRPEQALGIMVLHFKFWGQNEEKDPVDLNAQFIIEFYFHIDDVSQYIDDLEKRKISANIGVPMLSVAFSTARGIIMEKTNRTHFQDLIVPVIDPVFLLTEGMKGADSTED